MKPHPLLLLYGVACLTGSAHAVEPAARAPSGPAGLHARAIAAVRDERPEDAITLYKQLLAQTPEDLALQRDLMWLLWQTEHYEACAVTARQVASLAPGDREALNMTAQALHRARRYEGAAEAYAASLAAHADQPSILLARAHTHEAMRHYDAALTDLETLRDDFPAFSATWPTLARVREQLGDDAGARDAWAASVKAFPERTDYAYRQAIAIARSGQQEEGLLAMQALLASDPSHGPGRQFLVAQALITGDIDQAIGLLEQTPADPEGNTTARMLRLAGLHSRNDKLDRSLQSVNAILDRQPLHGDALLFKADSLLLNERAPEALAVFETVTRANPWSLRGWRGVANAHAARGDTSLALVALREARRLDPTHPYLLMREADLHYENKEPAVAREILETWLEKQSDPTLVVLLYHGLSTWPRDPMLASRLHMLTDTFADHLATLHDAGYESVTADRIAPWLRGDADLPERAVMIAFDDGRLDSFRQADPVLQRHGYQAVMFAAGINADRAATGYANWEQLKQFHDTGRWDIQSHGDAASKRIPVSPDGEDGMFLAYRAWLPDETRLETPQEWEARVREDYRSAYTKIADHLDTEAIAFAWPEGNLGQEGIPNAHGAVPLNIEAVKAVHRLGFRQDRSGVNVRTREPFELRRLEPSPTWSGDELLAYLRSQDPVLLVTQRLFRYAIEEGRLRDAARYLQTLSQQHAPRLVLLRAGATLAFRTERFERAAQLASTALQDLLRQDPPDPKAIQNMRNLAAHSLYRAGNYKAAAQLYRHSLRLNPAQPDIMRAVTELLETEGRFEQAALAVDRWVVRYPDDHTALPIRARILERLRDHAAAAQAWHEAANRFPERTDYRIREAEALQRAGAHQHAAAVAETILRHAPDNRLARDLLVNQALVKGNVDRAIVLLQDAPREDASTDAGLALRLAQLHIRRGNSSEAVRHLQTALQLDPENGDARLLYAECLRLDDRVPEAITAFEAILQDNRWCRRARMGVADAHLATGESVAALEALLHARHLDASDPALIKRQAEALYAAGQSEASRDLLVAWLQENPPPGLVVLLYHGLTTDPEHPMLASRIHMTTETFERHMTALHTAGYTCVDAAAVEAWTRSEAPLPDRPLLIAFDDGRLDSFEQADPILETLGFSAVMFAPTLHADHPPMGYADWGDLARYADTGRWEIQSHGDLASRRIPTDAADREGLFLVSRAWLPELGRMETREEWYQRMAGDYSDARRKLEQHLGARPCAFAWPEGNFGQEGIPGFADAAGDVLEAAGHVYTLGFNQDGEGINPVTRNAMRLCRLEPHPDWSGDDLVNHLADRNPAVLMALQLLKQATWQGNVLEATTWLQRVTEAGATRPTRLTAEAMICNAAGNVTRAQALLETARREREPREALSIQRAIDRKRHAQWDLAASYWRDDDSRQNTFVTTGYRWRPSRMGVLSMGLRVGSLREDMIDAIEDVYPYLALAHRQGIAHDWRVSLGAHVVSGPGDNVLVGSATWRSRLSDRVNVTAGFDRHTIDTAMAVSESIAANTVFADMTWDMTELWRSRLTARVSELSDDNTRITPVIKVSRQLEARPDLRLIAQFRWDDTRKESPAYYSPDDLRLLQAGFEYRPSALAAHGARLRYLGGYGIENGADSRYVNALYIDAHVRRGERGGWVPLIGLQQSPTYTSVSLSLAYRRRL